MKRRSLRLRLFTIIVLPLLLLALVIGIWRIQVAQDTAQELFDRNLMFTALAVSRDVSRSDGDAISAETAKLLSETAGGPVRYHVYGPNGVLVTGYAVPPIAPGKLGHDVPFAYYDASYRGDPERLLRIKDEASIDGVSGIFTITVWQDFSARNAFVWQLVLRSAAVMATLLAAVALLVWFGVSLGLKPLIDLEDAISRRSPEDLSPIQRPIPLEAQGLVRQLNALLSRISVSLDAQAAFVSDAAHQLRNPIAGMRALGESIQSATTLKAAQSRAADLVRAAAGAGDLANRLLTLERARAESGTQGFTPEPLDQVVARAIALSQDAADQKGVILQAELEPTGYHMIDRLMLREALVNLIDNALVHGGPKLTRVRISLRRGFGVVTIRVENDGNSVDAADVPTILARFGQNEAGAGSGLGLSIAEAVARRHDGDLKVTPRHAGFAVSIQLPDRPVEPQQPEV